MVDPNPSKKPPSTPPAFKAPQRPDELTRLETGLIDASQMRGDATQSLFDALQAAKDKQAASNRPVVTGVTEEDSGNILSKLNSQTYLAIFLVLILGLSAWGLTSILSKSGKQLDQTLENRKANTESAYLTGSAESTSPAPSAPSRPAAAAIAPAPSGSQPGFDLEKERERIRLKERELELEREKARERERERELERERERERELERERESSAAPPAEAQEATPPAESSAESESPPPTEAPGAEATLQ